MLRRIPDWVVSLILAFLIVFVGTGLATYVAKIVFDWAVHQYTGQ
jgi:hypothetical protein